MQGFSSPSTLLTKSSTGQTTLDSASSSLAFYSRRLPTYNSFNSSNQKTRARAGSARPASGVTPDTPTTSERSCFGGESGLLLARSSGAGSLSMLRSSRRLLSDSLLESPCLRRGTTRKRTTMNGTNTRQLLILCSRGSPRRKNTSELID